MRISFSRPGCLFAAATAAAVAVALIAPATAANAASITYTAPSWALSQVGTIMTVTTSFTASQPLTADQAGVCARNAGNGQVDFPFTAAVALGSTPATVTAARALSPGNYTMWACLKTGGYWHDVGSKYPVVVLDPATIRTYPTPVINPSPAAPSGQPMPVGDLPGWHQTFSDDFTTAQPAGTFPGSYAAKWQS